MKVYVAGPLNGSGNMGENIHNAMKMGQWLMDRGHDPYVPHLSAFMHMASPRPEKEWLKLDCVWLVQCDVLIRLPGVSPGADHEVDVALFRNIKVCYGIDEFLLWNKRFETSRVYQQETKNEQQTTVEDGGDK